jgi:hypothetical protein
MSSYSSQLPSISYKKQNKSQIEYYITQINSNSTPDLFSKEKKNYNKISSKIGQIKDKYLKLFLFNKITPSLKAETTKNIKSKNFDGCMIINSIKKNENLVLSQRTEGKTCKKEYRLKYINKNLSHLNKKYNEKLINFPIILKQKGFTFNKNDS